MFFSHGTSQARGILIAINNKFYCNVLQTKKDNDGRVLALTIEVDSKKYNLVAIYAPNQDKPQFFADIPRYIDLMCENTILCGDYNLVLDESRDRQGTKETNKRAQKILYEIMLEYSLVDIWRIRNDAEKQYMWSNLKTNKFSRLDYFLVSQGLDSFVDNYMFLTGIQTDHRAVFITITTTSCERGTGYWKFNNSYLKDEQYCDLIVKEIRNTATSICDNPKKKWEKIKERIKRTTKKYAKSVTSQDRLVESNLVENIQNLESDQPLSKRDTELLLKTRADLDDIIKKKTAGVIFRSRCRWHKFGEKNTSYFYNLEKRRAMAKNCNCLIKNNEETIHDIDEILKEQAKFYSELYAKNPEVSFDLINEHGIRVSEGERQKQNRTLTIHEMTDAVMQLSKNKSPGSDGITTEFYQKFWSHLKCHLHEALLTSFDEGKLFSTARSGVLNLIPKPNKDSRRLKNLRPITLLNVDYKIMEKCIANRMMPALHEIIHENQNGFIPGRKISTNIRKMLDIIDYLDNKNSEGIVISCDYQKCFDKIDFTALFGSLQFFGFAEYLIQWSKILYTEFKVQVQNSGKFSEDICIEQGIHQGGPASSCYFLVVAEIIALKLRNNKEIKGIPVEDIINILSQFADDMDIFSQYDQNSYNAIIGEITKFYYQSGFTISYDKTTVYRIGSLKKSNAKLYTQNGNDLRWTNDSIKVLGVDIYHDQTRIVNENYSPIVDKAQAITKQWSNRTLSILGKVSILNTLIASLLVYKMTVLPNMTDVLYKKFVQIFNDFLWQGGKVKIAYKIMCQPKSLGGAGLANLRVKEKSLKANWVKMLSTMPIYANTVYKMLAIPIQNYIWKCNVTPEYVKRIINKEKFKFWYDVFMAWAEYRSKHEYRIENQIIWFNSEILVQNNLIFFKEAWQKGLIYVHQLFEEGQVISAIKAVRQYNLSFLQLNAIITALPNAWKTFFKTTCKISYHPLPPDIYEMCTITENFTGIIYKRLIENQDVLVQKANKWQKDLNVLISKQDLIRNIKNIYRKTNMPKLRSFQFRLLQRAIITNKALYEWQIEQSPMCTFCKEEVETIEHLFAKCDKIKVIWNLVSIEMSKRLNKTIKIASSREIIMSCVGEGVFVDFITVLVKQWIYKVRCKKEELSFQSLKEYIYMVENTEKYIAIKNNTLNKHRIKWCRDRHETQANSQNLDTYVRNYAENFATT